MAQDKELLGLLRDANFGWVFIGIELPDPASLKEALKTQNLKEDALISVRRIYSYGIDVMGGFIIGFDNDTLETFDQQYRFITAAGIQAAMIGLLTAMPHTPLYERLRQEGRLRPVEDTADNTSAMTNIVPKTMRDDAMADAYRALYRRLLTSTEIGRRIRNKMRYLRAPLYSSGYSAREQIGIFVRLLCKGILPGGIGQTVQFLRSLLVVSPSVIPAVICDWIVGLSMRDFAEHRLNADAATATSLERRAASLRASIGCYLAQGKVTVTLHETSVPNLAIALQGPLDRRFFADAALHLRRLLKYTPASITLRIGSVQAAQSEEIKHLLKRLTRYGDRIFVVADDNLRTNPRRQFLGVQPGFGAASVSWAVATRCVVA